MASSESSLHLLIFISLSLFGIVKCGDLIVSGVKLKANMSYSTLPVGGIEDLEAGRNYFGDFALFYSTSYGIRQFPSTPFFGGLEKSTEKWVRRFLQINRDEFIYINKDDNCIHKFSRLNPDQAIDIAGDRRRKGFQDGIGKDAMFNYTFDIIVDRRSPGKVIVSDNGNRALRSVNLESGEVKTLANLSFAPRYMSWDHNNLSLLVSDERDVYNITLSEDITVEALTKGCCGDEEFFGGFAKPKEFLMLTEHVGVFLDPVDIDNRKSVLKAKDFRTSEPPSVFCPKIYRDCQILWYPKSLLYHDGVLYLGSLGEIYTITVEILDGNMSTTPVIPTVTTEPSMQSTSKGTEATRTDLSQQLNTTETTKMTTVGKETNNTFNYTSPNVGENTTNSSVPSFRLRKAYKMCKTFEDIIQNSTDINAASKTGVSIFLVIAAFVGLL